MTRPNDSGSDQGDLGQLDATRLRRIVLTVAILNFLYFFVEFSVALVAGSVALLADSVGFFEDTAKAIAGEDID